MIAWMVTSVLIGIAIEAAGHRLRVAYKRRRAMRAHLRASESSWANTEALRAHIEAHRRLDERKTGEE